VSKEYPNRPTHAGTLFSKKDPKNMPTVLDPKNIVICHKFKSLPHDWSTLPGWQDVSFSTEFSISHDPSLYLKALIFKDRLSMRRFWRVALESSRLTKKTAAVCTTLSSIVTYSEQKGKPQLPPLRKVDARYFAVLGFVQGDVTMEHIVHESVHAAYAYSHRVRNRLEWPDSHEPEEEVAYPAGHIASKLIQVFAMEGRIDEK